jgi:7,8-dihydropterin-6-yl-methyl-4-(beta-D-ribofuranosyl)aminobenzene 5'-phosphate synthase
MVPPPNVLLAEHGLSYLLKVYAGTEEHLVLFDAAVSATCFFHNVDLLHIDLSRIESMVLSHGHFDHFGALIEFLNRATQGISLILHPDAFLQRRVIIPGIRKVDFPTLDETVVKKTGVTLHKIKESSTLASNLILVLGEVERVTDFEKGFPWAEAKVDNEWLMDPFYDDQGVVVKVKDRGLVVIGGCSHAGIINTVKYAQKVAQTNKVHAVLGGFHLTGPIFDPIIGLTIEEMKRIRPDLITPLHCTGWKAITQFAQEMPEQFHLTTVGTTYVFQ